MIKSSLPKDHVYFDPNAGELGISKETREALKGLRVGDIVALAADVIDAPFTGGGGEYLLRLRFDTIKLTQAHFAIGDRARWHENGAWTTGEILAFDKSDKDITYAWVKENGKWPRRTLDVKELKR